MPDRVRLRRDDARMNIKFLAVASIAALAAACASTPPEDNTQPPTSGPVADQTTPPRGDTYQGPTPGTEAHFVATAGDRVFYDLDQYSLRPEARETLRRQAEWLNAYPGTTILVAGNCDERGTREYNLALGARRANAARDYLVSLGVSPSRISTVSYGKERPTCMQSNEACWAQNRNAITMIQGGSNS
jgi:peptidoglycan-associated lipoprotein